MSANVMDIEMIKEYITLAIFGLAVSLLFIVSCGGGGTGEINDVPDVVIADDDVFFSDYFDGIGDAGVFRKLHF